jgi:sugar-phosphatase
MASLRCRALLFDLDGVLVDSTPTVERTWRAWAARHGLDAAQVLDVAHGRRTRETLGLVAPHLDASTELAALAAAELADLAATRPLPGAAALLAALPEARWAVVTSGTQAVALGRLRAAGLPTPVVLVTAEDVTRGKPDPEGYLAAAARLGVDAPACVVVEDAPPGLAAATAAGMPTLGVLGTHTAAQLARATLLVPTLDAVQVEVDEPRAELIIRLRDTPEPPA